MREPPVLRYQVGQRGRWERVLGFGVFLYLCAGSVTLRCRSYLYCSTRWVMRGGRRVYGFVCLAVQVLGLEGARLYCCTRRVFFGGGGIMFGCAGFRVAS